MESESDCLGGDEPESPENKQLYNQKVCQMGKSNDQTYNAFGKETVSVTISQFQPTLPQDASKNTPPTILGIHGNT